MRREVSGEMTNHWIHRFGGGRSPGLRSPGGGRRTWVLLLVLGWLASASASLAAEIVEVRVGRHPTFTRVVFELDRAAGYRIERSDPSQDGPELVVSLQASSERQTLRSSKSFIEQVEIEPMGSTSVARVRLAKGDLRLKEMILANPPRIVLDLLDEGAVAKAVGAKKPAAVAEAKATPPPTPSTASAREDDDFDAVVAGIDGDRGGKTKPAPAPVRTAKVEPKPAPVAPKSAPTPKPAPKVEPKVEPKREPAPVIAQQPAPRAPASADATKGGPADMAEGLFDDDPQSAAADAGAAGLAANAPGAPSGRPSGDALAQADTAANSAQPTKPVMPAPAPAPAKAAEPRKPRPMVATSTTGDDEGSGWMTWALAGGGALVLLVGGGLLVSRLRGGRDDQNLVAGLDFEDDDAPADRDANPFAMSGADEETVVTGVMDDEATTIVASPMDSDEEKESESGLFDAEEKTMDDMEVISRDQVNESLGGAAMPPVGGVSEEVQQMFAEMTRRMEALESRCDELVDARDRLERQVAAQTEELRVQRAAIARTQRAVRNLGRGDESEEQEPTEPALREPTPPSGQ